MNKNKLSEAARLIQSEVLLKMFYFRLGRPDVDQELVGLVEVLRSSIKEIRW